MSERIVTIHQPDFMPWAGFFNKISKADIFVILDHTKNNPRDSAFWCRRVKIVVNKSEYWLSVPLVKPTGIISVPINEIKINLQDPEFIKKSLQTIKQNYCKTPFFKEIIAYIEAYYNDPDDSLSNRNMKFIISVMKGLRINPEIIYSSSLKPVANSTELLIEIVKKVDGSTYLCGGGANGYQRDELFEKNSIKLKYNNFKYPVYKQHNTNKFIPGLSIIDPLMNLGFEGTKELLTY